MLKKIKIIFIVHTICLINASIYNIKFILTHHSQVIIIYNLIIHNLQVYVRISQSYLLIQLTGNQSHKINLKLLLRLYQDHTQIIINM